MRRTNIKNMTNSELKTYKKMLRRRIVMRRRMVALLVAFILVIGFTVSLRSIISKANTAETNNMKYKYYTSVTVCYGDTLWDIAKEYVDYTKYSSMESYLKEVQKINHLNEDYDIVAGENIILPYYSVTYNK